MSKSHSSDGESFKALRHHDEYYLTGGDLFFLVQQYLFRVHRYFFERESTFFKGELTTPASPGESRRGTSEGNAVVLDGVSSQEFAKFLWVFYNPKYSLYHATPEDWTTILMLAHRWSFPEVKKLAIRELEKLEMADIQRIHVYQTYDVNRRLLVTRYAALCERLEPLTLEEGIKLGMATSLMIARARECVRSPSVGGCRSPSSVSIPTEEMQSIIKDLFNIPDLPSSIASSPVEEPKKQTNGTATKPSGGWRQPRSPKPPPPETEVPLPRQSPTLRPPPPMVYQAMRLPTPTQLTLPKPTAATPPSAVSASSTTKALPDVTVPAPAVEVAETEGIELDNDLDVGDVTEWDAEASADSETHVDSVEGSKERESYDYSEVGSSPDHDFNGHVVDPNDNDEGQPDESKAEEIQAGLDTTANPPADTGDDAISCKPDVQGSEQTGSSEEVAERLGTVEDAVNAAITTPEKERTEETSLPNDADKTPSAEVDALNSTVEAEAVPQSPAVDAVNTVMELENHEETASPERQTAGAETEVKLDLAPALNPEASTPKDGPLPNPDLPQGVSPTGDSSIPPPPDTLPVATPAPNDVDAEIDPSKSSPDGDSTLTSEEVVPKASSDGVEPLISGVTSPRQQTPAPELIAFSATAPHSGDNSSLQQESSLPDPVSTPLPDSLPSTPVPEPLIDVNAPPSSSVPADPVSKEGEDATLTVETPLADPLPSPPTTEPLVEINASPTSPTPADLPSKESANDPVKDTVLPAPASPTPVAKPVVETTITPSQDPPEDTLSKESAGDTITIDDSYYLTLPPLPPSPIDEPTVPPTTVAEDAALTAPPRTNPSSPMKGSNAVSPHPAEPEPRISPKKSATPSNGNPWAFLDEVPGAKASPPPPAPPPKNNPFMNAKSPVKESAPTLGGLLGKWGLGSSPSGGGLLGSFLGTSSPSPKVEEEKVTNPNAWGKSQPNTQGAPKPNNAWGGAGKQKPAWVKGKSGAAGATQPGAAAGQPSAWGAGKPNAAGAGQPSAWGAGKPNAAGATKPAWVTGKPGVSGAAQPGAEAGKPNAWGAGKPNALGTGQKTGEPAVKEPSASSATATSAKGSGDENKPTPSIETVTPVPQTDAATLDPTTTSPPSQDTTSSPSADAASTQPAVNSEPPHVPKLTIDTSTQWPNNLLGVFVPSVSTSLDTKSHSSLTTPQDLANTTAVAAADATEGSTQGAATHVNVDESVAKVVDSDVDEPPFVDAEQFHLTSSDDEDDSDSDSGFHSTSEDQPQSDAAPAPQPEETRV